MSATSDIRVPPIFQNYQQLGDFVMPTSNCNSYVSNHLIAKVYSGSKSKPYYIFDQVFQKKLNKPFCL